MNSRRDRDRLRRKRFWWVFGIVSFFLFLLAFGMSYRAVQLPYWQLEDKAVRQALAETELAEAEGVERFVWDEEYQIVYGNNAAGRDMIVWIGDSGIHSEYVEDGLSAGEVRRLFRSREPQAEVIKLVPGAWRGEWIWEVFYRKAEDKGTRHYYDFYRFYDGEHLMTYSLGIY